MKINLFVILFLSFFSVAPVIAMGLNFDSDQVEDKCFVLSQDFSDGKLKGYGSATSINEMAARSKAITYAHVELARQIEAIVEFTQQYYMEICEDGENTEFGDSLTQTILSQAKAKIDHSRIACSTREHLSDGKWRYSVCVVMEEEVAPIIKSLPEIENNENVWNDAVDAAIEEYLNKSNE